MKKINVVEEDLSEDNKKILKLSEIPWRDYIAEKGWNRDINKMCEICVKEQIDKHGKRVIPCKGLADAEQMLGEDVYKKITLNSSPEEIQLINSIYNPYEYMENFLDAEKKGKPERRFASRWYQEMVTRCLSGDTNILMKDKSYKKLEDLSVGDEVVTYNELKQLTRANKVLNKWYSGEKEVFKITLENGDSLEATEDHPILAWVLQQKTAYITIKEGLCVGMDVHTVDSNKVVARSTIISIELVGIKPTYDIEVDKRHNFIANNIVVHNCTAKSKVVRMGRRCIPYYEKVLKADGTYEEIQHLNIEDKIVSYRDGKKVTNRITNLWDNGMKDVYRITLENGNSIDCTTNHPLLTDKGWKTIETDLAVGDNVRVLKGKKKFTTSPVVSIEFLDIMQTYDISVEKDHNFIVNGIVTHNTGKTFALAILILHKVVTNDGLRVLLVSPYAVQTEEVIDNLKGLCALLPENPLVSSKASPNHVLTFNTGSILKGFTASTDANSVRGQPGHLLILDECLVGATKINTTSGIKLLKDINIGDEVLSEDGKYQKVTNMKMTGIKETYEYFYEDGNSLIGTTNHPVLTKDGFQPIEDASEVFVVDTSSFSKLIRKEYRGYQEVYNLTVEDTHTYVANGYLTHNCDDIPEKAMISIMGIKMDNPNVEIWRSGTPKGEMNLFKAEQDITSKSFHFPSFVIPHYSDALDKELREELGEIGFVQETMAEFGVVANGVFQNIFISQAQQRPMFITAEDVLKDRSRYIVVIGVDWNHEQVGTRIVVIAYDKLSPQFKVIEKAAVAAAGYTQQAAMDKIIHLNRKYNSNHIFCDEGFGVTQIGDLKRVGEAAVGVVPKGHPDLKLLDVQAVNFASNTEIRDPVSGDTYKTPTKQFAVQNTVTMLEKDLLSLHPKEDNDIILQMKNYIEKSRNKGRIIYSYLSKKIGDHDLDALMIGLYGYRQIYSSLFEGSVYTAMIKFANNSDPVQQINTDLYESSIDSVVQLQFSRPKHFSARSQKIGGFQTRNRSTFK